MVKKYFGLPKIPLYYSVPLLVISIFALGILLFLFQIELPSILLQPIPFNAINVSSCSNLNQTGAYYVLNQSIAVTRSPCINISANNVIFDGQYFDIIPSQGSFSKGVEVLANNVTVQNIFIRRSSGSLNYGIISSGNYSLITHTFINATNFGITLCNKKN